MSVLFGTKQPTVNIEKDRLQDTAVQTSTYGNTIPIIRGTTRVGGNVIWIQGDRLTEVKHVSTSRSGGKGGGGAKTKTTTYTYFASFATAFAEGVADSDGLIKIWGDGKLIIDNAVTTGNGQKYEELVTRWYPGTETQLADPAIQADKGTADTPNYRGIVYLVIDTLPLADFGNRIPNMTALLRFKPDNADDFSVVDFGPGALGAQGATPPDRDHPRPEDFGSPSVGGIIVDRQRSRGFVLADDVGSPGPDQRDGTAIQSINLNTNLVEFTRDAASVDLEPFDVGMGQFTLDKRNGNLIASGRTSAADPNFVKLFSPHNLVDLLTFGGASLTPIGVPNDISWFFAPLLEAIDGGTGSYIMYYSDLATGRALSIGMGTDADQPPGAEIDWNEASPTPGPPNMEDCVTDKNNFVWASGIRFQAGPMLTAVRHKTGRVVDPDDPPSVFPEKVYQADVGNPTTQGGFGFSGSPFEHFASALRIVGYDETTHSLLLAIFGTRLASEPTALNGGKIIRVDIDTLLFGDSSGAALPEQNRFLNATVASLDEATVGDTFGSQLGNAHRTSLKCGPDRGSFVLGNESGSTGALFTKIRVIDLEVEAQYDGEDWEDGTDIVIQFAASTGTVRSTICWDGKNNSILAPQTFGSTRLGWRRFFLDRQVLEDPLVSNIILDVCEKAGIPNSDVDVADLVTKDVRVPGYAMQEVESGRTALSPLLRLLNIDGFESGHTLKFRQRGDTTADHTIAEDALGGRKGLAKRNLKLTEISIEDQDIPDRVDVVHNDPARDYQEGNQYDQRIADPTPTTGNSGNKEKIESPIVLTATGARQAASRRLYSQWINRKKFDFNILQEFATMDPGDLASVTHDGRTIFGRVVKVKFGDSLLIGVTMVEEEPSVYTSELVGDGNPGGLLFAGARLIPFTGITEVFPMDIPLLQDHDDASSLSDSQCVLYVLMAGLEADWRGAVLSRSDTGANPFGQIEANFEEFAWGVLNAAVPAYDLLGDDVNVSTIPNGTRSPGNIRTFEPDEGTITVQIVRGEAELASTDEAGILNGLNAAIIGVRGAWEVIQYHTVIDNGNNEFELRGLVRGRRGTEPQTILGHVSGAFFFQLNPQAVIVQTANQSQSGSQIAFRADTVGSTMIDGIPQEISIVCNSLRPYSPALDSCTVDFGATDDITLIWVRRSRLGGEDDWFDTVEGVPLGETSEQYEVDALDGTGTVIRTFTNAQVDIVTNPLRPRIVYTAAQQVADGQEAGFPVDFKVYQLSSEVGRGFPLDVACSPPLTDNPLSLGVDLFWLDASDSTTITESGGAGTGVSTWADKSTAGSDWAQGSLSFRPQIDLNTLNSLPVVTFDGSNDHLDRAANITGRGDFTWIFLINKDSDPGFTAYEVLLETQNFRVATRTNQSSGPNGGNHVQLETGSTVSTNGRVLGSTDAAEVEGIKALSTAYSIVICTMDGAGQTMTLEVDGKVLRNARVSELLDARGNTVDTYVASGTLTNFNIMGFLTGDDVDIEDLPVADTGAMQINAVEDGGGDYYERIDGGSFVADGFLAGMGIVVEGFTTAQNNKALGAETTDRTIASVTASRITLDTGAGQPQDLADETGTGDERIVYDANAPNTIGTFGGLPTVGQDNVTIATSTLTVDSGGADPEVLEGPDTVQTGTIRQRSTVHPQGAVQTAGGTTVGSDNSSSERFEGSVAEMMGFAKQLTASQKLQMRLYLIDKWGL